MLRISIRGRAGTVLGVLLLVLGGSSRTKAQDAQVSTPAARPELGRLKRHVEVLASREFEGRSGPGARKAEAYVTNGFRALGLEPLFGESYTQDIPGEQAGRAIGRNVGAKLRGIDPARAGEWIILSAHYDHLGKREGGVYFPGADDNASGVAMLLEVARCFVENEEKPGRGVMFVSFDLEEAGLIGSRHFVEEPPVPLEQVKLFLTADLIGGALGGVCREQVFVVGSEHVPGLRPWIDASATGSKLIRPAVVGSDLLVINRSDYGPFRSKRVPYLFFSTGENPRYHTPSDDAASLDYPKLEAVSQMIAQFLKEAANAKALPVWQEEPEHVFSEVVALRDVVRTIREHREALKIQGISLTLVNSTLEQLEAVVKRGRVTPEERAKLVRSAQILLLTVL